MQQDRDIEMEMQVWEYIDGLCNAADKERIGKLISQEPAWGAKYEQLLQLHHTIDQKMELEQPSMRFTMNVMDAVKGTYVAPAAKNYLNKWVIRSIAAFVGVMIGGLLISAVVGMEATTGDQDMFSWMSLDKIETPTLPLRTLMYTFLFCNALAALLLLDGLMRKKRHTRHI